MKISTKFFGEIEIAEEKIITFERGIVGFPQLKRFALLHDEEKGTHAGISFLQSLEEPGFSMPVMDPLVIKPDYEPEVSEELLSSLGRMNPENLLVLVTISIPSDLTRMSVNLQGPVIINVEQHRGCQIILDNREYPVKFPIYEILQAGKAGA